MTTQRKSIHYFAKPLFIVTLASPLAVYGQVLVDSRDQAATQMQAAQIRVLGESMQKLSNQGALEIPAETPTSQPLVINAKKPGVIRIGLSLPTNKMDGRGQLNDGEPIRAAEQQLLNGPQIEAVNLKAILPAQAMREAELLDCDYVLTSSVSQHKVESQGRFGKLGAMRALQMATTVAQLLPGVGTTAMLANMAVSSAASQASSNVLSNLANGVKANSDVTLEYTLTDKNSSVTLSGTEKERSRNDGDSLLTSMLTTAATKIVSAIKH